MRKFAVTGLIITGIIALSGFSLYGYANSTRSAGIQHELGLVQAYNANMNERSAYIAKIYEMTDVANLKSEKMDEILSNAISGRYGENGFSADGAFFAAVHEAYPQLDLTLYDRIVDAVQAGQEAFKNRQNHLQDMIKEYNFWRQDGIVRSMLVGNFFPSDNLAIKVDGTTLYGRSALDKMSEMILMEQAQKEFSTGEMKTLDLKNR